jgi:hypothetical protein
MSRILPIGLRIASNTQSFGFIGTSQYYYFNQLKHNLNVNQSLAQISKQLICPTLTENTKTSRSNQMYAPVFQFSLLPLTTLLKATQLFSVQLSHSRFFFNNKKIAFASARFLLASSLGKFEINNINVKINKINKRSFLLAQTYTTLKLIDQLCTKPFNKKPLLVFKKKQKINLDINYNKNRYANKKSLKKKHVSKFLKSNFKNNITALNNVTFTSFALSSKAMLSNASTYKMHMKTQKFISRTAKKLCNYGFIFNHKKLQYILTSFNDIKNINTDQKIKQLLNLCSFSKFVKTANHIEKALILKYSNTKAQFINPVEVFNNLCFVLSKNYNKKSVDSILKKKSTTYCRYDSIIIALTQHLQLQTPKHKKTLSIKKIKVKHYKNLRNHIAINVQNIFLLSSLQQLINTKNFKIHNRYDLKSLPLPINLSCSSYLKTSNDLFKNYDNFGSSKQFLTTSYIQFSNFMATFSRSFKNKNLHKYLSLNKPQINKINQSKQLIQAAKMNLVQNNLIASPNAKVLINQTFNAPRGLHNFYLVMHRFEKSQFNFRINDLYKRLNQQNSLTTEKQTCLELVTGFQNVITFELFNTSNSFNSHSLSMNDYDLNNQQLQSQTKKKNLDTLLNTAPNSDQITSCASLRKLLSIRL